MPELVTFLLGLLGGFLLGQVYRIGRRNKTELQQDVKLLYKPDDEGG